MSADAALILAAGAARRWKNGPKALARWRDRPLIDHVCEVALIAGAHPVRRVLGAHHELILAGSIAHDVATTLNINWAAGMGESLACGARALLEDDNAGDCAGTWILLCDQPLVTAQTLLALRDEHLRSGAGLVFSVADDGRRGPPAYVARAFWTALANLTGETGARALATAYPDQVALVPALDSLADIDTFDDYARLIAQLD